ncbi:MAG: sensor histidine kinase [Campylobacteraceae bacterium]|nr:sensor histidine kinase [Campylobacteraceae bacterium]
MNILRYKFFIFFVLLLSNIYAQSFRSEMFKNLYYSFDNKEYKSIVHLKDENFAVEKDEELKSLKSLKIKIDQEYLKDKVYYLKITSNNTINEISFNHTKKEENFYVRIDEYSDKTLIIHFNKPDPLIDIEIYSLWEYEHIYPHEKLIFGFVYGIIFCALFYNLILYIYNKKKYFLYYAFLQFAVLCLLLSLYFSLDIFVNLSLFIDIQTFFVYLILISSGLFAVEFLNTKKHLPKMDFLIKTFILFGIANIFFLLFWKEVYFDEGKVSIIALSITVVSSILRIMQKSKEAIFYLLGHVLILISVLIIEMDLIDINQTYLIHLVFPIDVLFFAFAISYKLKQSELKRLKNESLLIHQNKLASMGEMIANIAHQWRQPLTHLSYAYMNVQTAFEHDKLDKEYFDKKSCEIVGQIEFMSNTINDFRDFFQSNKKTNDFEIKAICEKTYALFESSFSHSNILFTIKSTGNTKIHSYENEFSQVVFNILNNAKQQLLKEDIQKPSIFLTIEEKQQYISIEIEDNAKGIKEENLNKIFEPYFSTKDNGMGLGLYMSKVIIEDHMKAKLGVKNSKNGAVFMITLPKKAPKRLFKKDF